MIKIDDKNTIKKEVFISKAIKNKTKNLHAKLHSGQEPFTGWINFPSKLTKKYLDNINEVANKIRQNVDVLLVIGIGGSYMGGQAALDALLSKWSKPKTEVIFIGYSLSEKHIANLKKYLKEKKFAINVISKSGTTIETLVIFEEFKKLLKKKQPNNWNKYIYATTDAKVGKLKKEANQNSYQTFDLLDSIGGRYSVITPVGLLPIAIAGINIYDFAQGAKKAQKDLSKVNNYAYKYAQLRYVLSKKYFMELLVTYSPDYFNLMNWVQQLYAESEGKKGKGLFPTPSLFSRDLHSIGQFIQEGKQNFIITTTHVQEPEKSLIFNKAKKTFNELNDIIFKSSVSAHYKKAKINNIVLKLDKMDSLTLGYYFYFHMKACAMTSYLSGVNPFDQPGVEVYKSYMRKYLK